VVGNNLLHKEVKIRIEKIDGFYAPVAFDGRMYIPEDVIKNRSLYKNDIVSIKAIENNKIIHKEYTKIYLYTRLKRKKKEFICYLNKNLYGKNLVFQIEKLPTIPQNRKISPLIAQLFRGMHYAFIDKDSAIIFQGNKVPAIINSSFKLSDFVTYLGAYFADGTRKGNYWAICASTFEQARYYLKMHNLLIKDSKPEFIISYTNIYNINENDLKRNLAEIWYKEAGVNVDKFRIRSSTGKLISKWNKYGTFIMREPRQILIDVYGTLLKLLIKEILFKKDEKLAIDFLCGVMEGDGCAPAAKRGHVMIFTNKNDVHTLENILKVAEIRFKVVRDSETKYALRIGALEILRNFRHLKDKIFSLYSKRKRIFFERLNEIKTVKFLIENHEPASGVKAWLRDNDFCDKNYKITDKGLKLGKELSL